MKKDLVSIVSESFYQYLNLDMLSSKSVLSNGIAQDIHKRLGKSYDVFSAGYGNAEKNITISGNLFEIGVDIAIKNNGHSIAGFGIVFLTQNFSETLKRYIEPMFGKSAMIRTAHCLYFQVIVVLDKIPKVEADGTITGWEFVSNKDISDFETIILSNDSPLPICSPNKTLIYVVHISDNEKLKTLDGYLSYYKKINFEMELSQHEYEPFGSAVILNDYEIFMEKVYHTILAI